MERNIDFDNYISYVVSELNKIETRNSKLVLNRINELGSEQIDKKTILFIETMNIFIKTTESIDIAIYSDWFKYLKNE